MNFKDSVYSESTLYAFRKSFFIPALRPAFCKCIPSIIKNFFLRQYHSALIPGRIPVTRVDHELDEKIPFVPSWVDIYIDFTQLWIRMISFFIRRYGRKAYLPVRDFIYSMGDLYAYAAEVYKRNLSTTKRPFYISRPRFFMIHLLDPHLMCIPSLHVMVVIHAYTQFISIAKKLGEYEKLAEQGLEIKQGALAISQAIFYVKQHSINCMPAALYAMTNFRTDLFPPEEAEKFIEMLFSPAPAANNVPKECKVHPSASPTTKINETDQEMIKNHVLNIYRQFLQKRDISKPWYSPIINFLQSMPKVS